MNRETQGNSVARGARTRCKKALPLYCTTRRPLECLKQLHMLSSGVYSGPSKQTEVHSFGFDSGTCLVPARYFLVFVRKWSGLRQALLAGRVGQGDKCNLCLSINIGANLNAIPTFKPFAAQQDPDACPFPTGVYNQRANRWRHFWQQMGMEG